MEKRMRCVATNFVGEGMVAYQFAEQGGNSIITNVEPAGTYDVGVIYNFNMEITTV